MVKRWILILLAIVSFLGFPAFARQGQAERQFFKETKAKADKGDAPSQLAVGRLYAAGMGVASDDAKAVKYYRKAAEQGLSQAQFQLGLQYAAGEGVKTDSTEA